MSLSIEQRMALSQAMGAPVEDFVEKSDKVNRRIRELLTEAAETPREAVLLLAAAFLFFTIKFAVDKDSTDCVEKAKDLIDSAAHLIIALGDEDE